MSNVYLALFDGLHEQVDQLVPVAVLGQQEHIEAGVRRRQTIRVRSVFGDDQF